MATKLTEYQELRRALMALPSSNEMDTNQLILFQELSYRIEVLEVCQTFCKNAPLGTDGTVIVPHYQLLDAYIQCLTKERRFGYPTDDKGKAQRAAAADSLEKVVQDCRKRFSSFRPNGQDHYKKSIGTFFNTVLPVWLQFRNTYINI